MGFIASSAQTVAVFVVLLLTLVFVHELGHFLAAKATGVKVERFSLGFPPKAVSKTIGETEYQLAWLPLGGYVKMYGEEVGAEGDIPPHLARRSFCHQPALVKMAIVAAGPFFNVAFAVLLFWALTWAQGVDHLAPLAGYVAPGGPADQAGLRAGDTLVAVGGRPIKYFDELEALAAAGAPLEVTYRRPGQPEATVTLAPERLGAKDAFGQDVAPWSLGLEPLVLPTVDRVMPGSPAERAGLRRGDTILSIDGRAVTIWEDVVSFIQGPRGQRAQAGKPPVAPLSIVVARGAEHLTLVMTPELNAGQDAQGRTTYTPLIGITPQVGALKEPVGVWAALARGARDVWGMIDLTVTGLKKIATGQISAKTMGGPILIAEVAGDSARDGLTSLLRLAAFISVNLGILNLLPVPVLDGGQLVIFAIEAARRRPVGQRAREVGQWVGLGFLALLMVTVFYNDISRLVDRFSAASPPAAQEAGQ